MLAEKERGRRGVAGISICKGWAPCSEPPGSINWTPSKPLGTAQVCPDHKFQETAKMESARPVGLDQPSLVWDMALVETLKIYIF